MKRKTIFWLAIVLVLAGCDQRARFDRLIPQDEAEFSKEYVALFQSRDFDAIEEKLNPNVRDAQLRPKLK